MYYSYESDENISDGGQNYNEVLFQDEDLSQDEDEDQFSNRLSLLNSESDDKEVQFIDQSRIVNLSEVKVFLDEVICPICCHIIVDPKICNQCDQTFCSNCIERWFKKSLNHQCPCCRKSLNKNNEYCQNQGIMDGKVPKVILKLLGKLMLTCRYSKEGCEEIISYDFREKHENQYCLYQEKCCENDGCYKTMCLKDFEDHQLECIFGVVQCKYCQEDKLRMDIELHLLQCECRPVLCEWCKEKYQFIDIDKHLKECEFKDIFCECCKKKFKKYDMKFHTPIFCLNNLYMNSLELIQQKDDKIFQLQQQIKLLKQNKPIEQSDLNQSTNEILSEKYKQDFEDEVEEVIEEDIQIEDNDQEEQQQQSDNNEEKSNQDYKSESLSYDNNNQEKHYLDELLDLTELPSIQDIKMRGMYTSFLEKKADIKYKDLWNYSEDEFNQVIDLLK
ncbi:unnamed protein product [Paramecium sonneborni]|uniref:RING-type domain-containing protein n=1 Tax=Paramecium sonneborni TaxID=65129 RepID=A0A8S1RTG1_9CILI|nr:unnamed protein product [Paramecium sonneborni]